VSEKRPSRAAKIRPISEEPVILGRVIAEREYRVGRRKILLQVGTPRRASFKTAFYCPFRLVEGRNTKLHRAFGHDALQALMLAFDAIKNRLEGISPKIRWVASPHAGDIGVYRRLTISLGVELDRRIERFADKAIRQRGRDLKRAAMRRAKG
jgi:hypothetical protein